MLISVNTSNYKEKVFKHEIKPVMIQYTPFININYDSRAAFWLQVLMSDCLHNATYGNATLNIENYGIAYNDNATH